MPKIATPYALTLPPRKRGIPAYQWLYESVRVDILAGRLRQGTRLPGTRDLARQYGVARGTIVNAFDQLASEGYVEGSVGSGTYVSKVLPERLLNVASHSVARASSRGKHSPSLSKHGYRAKLFQGYENRSTRAFRANLPAVDLFPTMLWAKLTQQCLKGISSRNLMGCDALGHFPLRQAVAEYLGKSRGVKCEPQQVAIVTGVQEALDLTARLFLNPGDRACVEDPGYSGARLAFQAYGAKIIAAPLDDEGIAVSTLPARGVRLAYVTPGHQFPMGITMSLTRRLQLLEWAHRSDAVIFEDDYDSEYRYSGRPIPCLQGLDSNGVVLYASSFSKVLFPALRLGYVVVPLNLLPHFEALQSITLRHAPLLEQLVLTDFIMDGHFGRHLRRMRQIYAERLAVLLEEARIRLGGLLEISKVEAGLQTVGWLCNGKSAHWAATAAAKRNVDVTPLDHYSVGKATQNGLQLGFAAMDVKEIRRGARELAVALDTADRQL